jgi:hypothetical protein
LNAGWVINMASLTSAVSVRIPNNTTSVSLYDTGAGGFAALDDTNFTDTTQLGFSGFYQVAS